MLLMNSTHLYLSVVVVTRDNILDLYLFMLPSLSPMKTLMHQSYPVVVVFLLFVLFPWLLY